MCYLYCGTRRRHVNQPTDEYVLKKQRQRWLNKTGGFANQETFNKKKNMSTQKPTHVKPTTAVPTPTDTKTGGIQNGQELHKTNPHIDSIYSNQSEYASKKTLP